MEIPGLQPVDPNDLDLLRHASTATLATVMFKLGYRNRALTDIRAIVSDSRMVGEAVTLRYIPGREDMTTAEHLGRPGHPQRETINAIGPGQVLVVDAHGDISAGTLGDILSQRLKQNGAAGFVTDGAVRDATGIRQVGIASYARSVHPNASFHAHEAVEANVPIGCAGVAVYPGDIVVGDPDGVVVIPRHLVSQVARPAADQEAMEVFIMEKVAGGASLIGTYPPNDATKAEYARWQEREGRG